MKITQHNFLSHAVLRHSVSMLPSIKTLDMYVSQYKDTQYVCFPVQRHSACKLSGTQYESYLEYDTQFESHSV
jgi:hypothetical protein